MSGAVGMKGGGAGAGGGSLARITARKWFEGFCSLSIYLVAASFRVISAISVVFRQIFPTLLSTTYT